MKKTLLVVLAMGLLVGMVPAGAQTLKTGRVNFFKVLNGYKKTKDYEDILRAKAETATKSDELENKKQEILKMRDKMELVKDQEKGKYKQDIQKAIVEYQKEEMKIRDALKKERDVKFKEITDEITKAIKNYAQGNGFDLVFEDTGVLYDKSGADLTDKILKILNKNYDKSNK